MTFPTHSALARALAARGYTEATPVQRAILEAETAGRDLVVSAQTGSGKTVAFGMAMAATLLGESEKFDTASTPVALIVAPTRELAMQVQRELDWLYAETDARVVACVGGMDARYEARQLSIGAHIVVGTPGRLRDHLERGRLVLTGLRCIVLDEADEMLDLGFREDLEFILEATPAERRTLLFSATMPREIEALATRYQNDAIRIATTQRNEQHADIEYQAMRVAPHDVENAVVNVLRFNEARAAIVFCTTREAVKRMHGRLFERGFAAVALSGELTQNDRMHALQALRDGRARVLVATDVAARGLDLPDLALVIHAELPHDHETLLHRSGRTGRAGRKGLCVLIVPYHRRRKAEALLGAARLRVHWRPAPTADEIRARDHARLLEDAIFADVASDEDTALARLLQENKTPDEIALALARMQRARLPAPEDLTPDTGPPARERREPRENYRREDRDGQRRERHAARTEDARNFPRENDRSPGAPRRAAPRLDDPNMVWFRLNIGRERNADPRWLLPLICKAGGVSKSEVGAIKIFDKDSRFQIAAPIADQFEAYVRANSDKEGQITRADRPVYAERSTKRFERPHRPAHSPADGSSEAAFPAPETSMPPPGSDAEPAASLPSRERSPDTARPQREFRPQRHQSGKPPRPQGKKPHRKGQRPPEGRAHAAPQNGRPAQPHGERSPSKYAQKKKKRAEPASP